MSTPACLSLLLLQFGLSQLWAFSTQASYKTSTIHRAPLVSIWIVKCALLKLSPAWWGRQTGSATAHPYLHLESGRHGSGLRVYFHHSIKTALPLQKRGGVWSIASRAMSPPSRAPVRWGLEEKTMAADSTEVSEQTDTSRPPVSPLRAIVSIPANILYVLTPLMPKQQQQQQLHALLPLVPQQQQPKILHPISMETAIPWAPKKETCHFCPQQHCFVIW